MLNPLQSITCHGILSVTFRQVNASCLNLARQAELYLLTLEGSKAELI